MGMAAGSFPVTVLSASIPTIATDLGASKAATTWVISAPILVFAVFTPIAGKLGDLFGHRRMYLLGFSFNTVMLACTVFAWDLGSLIALRTLAQAGGAVTGPAAMAFIITLFSGHERSRALGFWTATAALSPSLGIVIGAPLIDLTSWRVLFVMQTVLAIVVLLVAYPTLPETTRRSDISFDIPGAVTLGLAVGGFLFAVNRVKVWGIDDPRVFGPLVTSPILILLFWWIENRTDAPLIPPMLLRQRGFSVPLATQMLVSAAYMGGFVVTPLLLEGVFGYTTAAIGFMMLPRPIMFGVFSMVSGNLERTTGARRLVAGGALLVAVGLVVVGGAAALSVVAMVLFGIALTGIGQGLSRPPLVGSVGASVDDENLGVAGGVLQMSGQVGVASGITVLTAIVGESTDASSFVTVFAIAAGLALSGAAVGSLIRT